MVFRLSTLSTKDQDGVAYKTGDLSLYPELLDDEKSLYIVKNNAETPLKQTLGYNGKWPSTRQYYRQKRRLVPGLV